MTDLTTTNEITKNTILIRATGGARVVHSIDCPYIKDWDITGTVNLDKYNHKNMKACTHPTCNILVNCSIGAKDYRSNRKKYLQLFLKNNIKPELVREFYTKGRAKTEFYGDTLFIHSKKDDWKIEFCLDGEIKLWHNNYQTSKRKNEDSEHFAVGYHEHKLTTTNKLKEAILQIIKYDYKHAKKNHNGVKERKTFREIIENE